MRACLDPDDDGFEQAFEALYERYRDRVFGIAYRMLGTTADAMDVVQEAFSLVFRKIATFRFDSKFSTWLFRIVVNCCVDQKRRDSGRTLAPLSDAGEVAHEFAIDPLQAAATLELGDHVHLGLQRLSPKLRAVLVLRYLEDLSYDEVAAALDVSLGTVKSRLARAHVAFESVLGGTLRHFGYPVDTRFARSPVTPIDPITGDAISRRSRKDGSESGRAEGVA